MNNSLFGPLDPARDAGWVDPPPRKGFLTDTSICIGCKACEVACKEWNAVPEDGLSLLGSSYDNTGSLGASTWRHFAFIEQPTGATRSRASVDLGMPSVGRPGAGEVHELPSDRPGRRRLMTTDVCQRRPQ